jgi:cell division initiation protein
MKYSPHSIKNQEFNRSVRGYDKDEVRAFLEKLSDEVERIQSENEYSQKEITDLRERVKDYKRIEKNLQNTLLNAQESSSKAVESAKKQTALMLKEAELKANQLLDEAKEDAEAIRNSVLKLREEKKLLMARIKAMIDSQSSLLELDVANMDTEEISRKEKTEEKKTDIDIDDIVEKLI